MIYLDTAALVKLVRREVASDELVDWLNEQGIGSSSRRRWQRSSCLALFGGRAGAAHRCSVVLSRIGVCDVDEAVRTTAAAYQDPWIRVARRDSPRYGGCGHRRRLDAPSSPTTGVCLSRPTRSACLSRVLGWTDGQRGEGVRGRAGSKRSLGWLGLWMPCRRGRGWWRRCGAGWCRRRWRRCGRRRSSRR